MTKDEFLNQIGEFAWGWSEQFFIECGGNRNFIWSDPEYYGDNTIQKFNGSIKDWYRSQGIEEARDKGKHLIREYCGEDVKIEGIDF